MSKHFSFNGDIVDREASKTSPEDICPADVERFLSDNQEEDIEFDINSCGGDVFAGIAICNMIRKHSSNHKTTANIMSIAASIASVIACACDEINISSNAFLMVHLPWCSISGNKNELAKEIERLEQCKDVLVSIYARKFNLAKEEIEIMMDNETWILGSRAKDYGLDCNIVETNEDVKIAARISTHKYSKMPKELMDKITHTNEDEEKKEIVETEEVKNEEVETEKEEVKNEETEEETVEKTEEMKSDEMKTEEMKNEETDEDEKTEEDEEDKEEGKMISLKEANKRVSGMQSKMGKQINEFRNQIKAKDEELTHFKNEVTSLKSMLENAKSELSKMASALEEKTNALEILNSSCNAPAKSAKNVDWRKLRGQEFFNWLESSKH